MAFGSDRTEAFQVAVSSLTLGTLYEAILEFSAHDRLDTFWPSVCRNTRWLIPSRRMAILLCDQEGDFEVVGIFEQGKYQPFPGPRHLPRDEALVQVLTTTAACWLDNATDRFREDNAPLTDWLLRDRPAFLFVLPMRVRAKSVGAVIFATGLVEPADRAMLNTLGTIYALHVAMTYKLIGITEERRQMQERLIMQEKMASLGSLVAGVAHEVNTPIGAIISAADISTRCIQTINELTQHSEADNPRLRRASALLLENNEVIAKAGKRISNMVQSLKNFARLDEAEFKTADLHEGIESTLQLVQHELGERISVIRDFGDLPRIQCYPSQLNQVFMNLLLNAAHSIEGDGTITIKTFAGRESVYVDVSDTGKGIPAEHLGKIFDPGFTTKGGLGVGTGFGLAICYRIMRNHEGTISVQSEVGCGTTFTLMLPQKHLGATE